MPDQSTHFAHPPTAADIDHIARQVMMELPDAFTAQMGSVVVQVEAFADEDVLRSLDCGSPYDLLGLYQGISLEQKSIADSGAEPDLIFLYHIPLLCYWVEEDLDLTDLVRHVLIHEIGHHFGFSDADMDNLQRHADDMSTI